MSGKRKILIATTNPGKIAEIRAMSLDPALRRMPTGGDGLEANVNWLGLSDFPALEEIEEDGSTFAENARKKAAGYAKATGLWTLADDSGLVVDALGGEPGVKSARFNVARPSWPCFHGLSAGHLTVEARATPKGKACPRRQASCGEHSRGNRTLIDHRNIAKVLKLLEGIPKEKRTARFVCHLCLASPDKILAETEGTLEGLIAEKEIGENGFGYDPIFFVPHLNKTVGQFTAEEKNAISHRGNAIRKLKPLLEQLLKSS